MEVSGVTAIESMPAAGARTCDHSPFRRNADSLTYDAPLAQLVIDEHPGSHRHLLDRLCPTERFATRLHNLVLKQALSPASRASPPLAAQTPRAEAVREDLHRQTAAAVGAEARRVEGRKNL